MHPQDFLPLAAARPSRDYRVLTLQGRKAVLAQRPLLEAFAARCEQPDALHWLAYFLNFRGRGWKLPVLVLVVHPGASPSGCLRPEDLAGASLFMEYRPLGLPTWSAITDEVVAPAEDRSAIAALAANAMLHRGVHLLGVQFASDSNENYCPSTSLDRGDIEWVRADRELKQTFTLGTDYDSTLARFGKGTRTNFRYYRKRFVAAHNPEFFPDAANALTEQDLLDLNSRCRNPIPESQVRRRHAASTKDGGFLTGLRLPSGEWISAIGGWRSGTTTMMQWQANADGYDKESLVTVMRAFFLENETLRGTHRLILVAGTSHSMRSAFAEQRCSALYVRRRSLRSKFVRAAARIFERDNFFTRRANLLARTMRDPALEWQPGLALHPVAPPHGLRASEAMSSAAPQL